MTQTYDIVLVFFIKGMLIFIVSDEIQIRDWKSELKVLLFQEKPVSFGFKTCN